MERERVTFLDRHTLFDVSGMHAVDNASNMLYSGQTISLPLECVGKRSAKEVSVNNYSHKREVSRFSRRFSCGYYSFVSPGAIATQVCLFMVGMLLFNSTAHSQNSLREIVSSYVELAIPDKHGRIRKFEDAKKVTYGMDCFDDALRCNETLGLLPFTVFHNANMQTELSLTGKVRFVFAAKRTLPYLREKMGIIFSQGITDTADLDCQLYTHIKSNQTTAAAIVISLDAPVTKRVVCMLVNFSRVLGLSQKSDAPFSKTWLQNGFSEKNVTYAELMSDTNFLLTVNALKVLSYIHACQAIGPGMSRSALIAELTENSVCLLDLKTK